MEVIQIIHTIIWTENLKQEAQEIHQKLQEMNTELQRQTAEADFYENEWRKSMAKQIYKLQKKIKK